MFSRHQVIVRSGRQYEWMPPILRSQQQVMFAVLAIYLRQHLFPGLCAYSFPLLLLNLAISIKIEITEIALGLQFPLPYQIFGLAFD